MNYIRRCQLVFLYLPLLIVSILAGGWFVITVPIMAMLAHILEDNLAEPDLSAPKKLSQTWLLDLILHLHLPISAAVLFVLLWQATPGDFLGFGSAIEQLTGWDVLNIHNEIGFSELLGMACAVGFMLSTNTIVAHELVHRTADKLALLSGRWMLAIVGDAQFSISHVYGHHTNVGTLKDPATARRGESLYHFFVRSSIGQYKEAWNIEKKRLERLGMKDFVLKNHFLTGLLMTLIIVLIFFLIAGWVGLVIFAAHCLISKFLFETVNYIEHYGLVRSPGTQVAPRHSWDCNRRGVTRYFYNLNRHSDHHVRPRVPFWELRLEPDTIKLRYGYLAHVFLAMVPPLWHRIAASSLMYWDKYLASEDEVRLATAANAKSGIKCLAASMERG